MRVLLMGVTGLAPETGGGYTLSQDVFAALLRRAENTIHHFFVLQSAPPSNARADWPARLSPIALERSFKCRLIEQLVYRLFSLPPFLRRGQLRRPKPGVRAIQQLFRSHQIDCALCLDPKQASNHLPNIITVWDLNHRCMPYWPEVSIENEWTARDEHYSRHLPRATAIVTGTKVGKAEIEAFYGVAPDVIKVIPFPTPIFALDAAAVRPSFERLPPGVSGEFLFYPAQYWPHKNHVRLLHALKLLRELHGWNGTLVFCGSDKGNLSYLREKANQYGVEDFVHFLGFVTRPELLALYSNAFAMPFVSHFGPDNLPPLEAFALGCPVIAADSAGAREQLGEAALFSNPASTAEIVNSILQLSNSPELRTTMIARGRLRAQQNSVDDYAERMLGILDDLEPRFECFRCTGANLSDSG